MAKAGYSKVDSVRIVKEDIWRVFGQFEKSRISEIGIFWFSQYSTMGPLEVILTLWTSESPEFFLLKMFLGWF